MTWQLRRARPDDLGPIMELETGTFGTDAWSSESMESELASPHAYYLVAERLGFPGVIDGYAGLLAPSGSPDGDIQTIAVAETARRGGLGRTLVRSLVTEARKRGAKQVFLEVRADNPVAQHLYLSLDFEQIAVRPHYYQPDGVDALIMKLVIPEPELRPAVNE